jgi:hypothetical protein
VPEDGSFPTPLSRKPPVRFRPNRAQSSRSEYCARNAGRQIAEPDKQVKEERCKSFEFYRHQLADVTITTFDELIAKLRAPLAFLKPAQSPEKGSPLAVPAQGAVPQSGAVENTMLVEDRASA